MAELPRRTLEQNLSHLESPLPQPAIIYSVNAIYHADNNDDIIFPATVNNEDRLKIKNYMNDPDDNLPFMQGMSRRLREETKPKLRELAEKIQMVGGRRKSRRSRRSRRRRRTRRY